MRRVLAVLGLTAGFLAATELGVQTWARYFRAPYETYDRSAGTPALVPGVYESGHGPPFVVNESGFAGPPLSSVKEGLWRIVAIGDSCTVAGGSESYPALLQKHLDDRSTNDRHYEVVNAAIAGLDSRQALKRLVSKVPSLEPKVVTVYLGWNDLMKFAPRSQRREAIVSDLWRFIDRFWTVRGLRKLMFFHIRPRLESPLTGSASHTCGFDRFSPSYFEENLRAIIHATRDLGARALLLTLPSPVRVDMDLDDLHRARVQFPYFASCYAVGDFVDLIDSYNRAIRRVGIEEQVPVVDLAESFMRIPDTRGYFFDSMHPSALGTELIARLVASALVREGLVLQIGSSARAWASSESGTSSAMAKIQCRSSSSTVCATSPGCRPSRTYAASASVGPSGSSTAFRGRARPRSCFDPRPSAPRPIPNRVRGREQSA